MNIFCKSLFKKVLFLRKFCTIGVPKEKIEGQELETFLLFILTLILECVKTIQRFFSCTWLLAEFF